MHLSLHAQDVITHKFVHEFVSSCLAVICLAYDLVNAYVNAHTCMQAMTGPRQQIVHTCLSVHVWVTCFLGPVMYVLQHFMPHL